MKNRPKIALVGSRGIPPRYGGAETFVYELSKRLKEYFDIYVTCESDHFGIDEYEGIKRVHIWAKHTPTTTIPIIYDIIATLYLLKKVKDIRAIYYVAPDGAYASIIAKIAKKKTIINTDGIEWKRLLIRMNYAPLHLKPLYLTAAVALLIAEFLASKLPDITIADSLAIKKHLEQKWKTKKVVYISYGVRKLPQISEEKQRDILHTLGLKPISYYLTIARLVPENGIHLEIEAFKKTTTDKSLVIVGPLHLRDTYIKHLIKLKGNDARIRFLGGIYDSQTLSALRANCTAYIHPYTVGGTNPSLLEQMLYDRPIIAYDVPFHREILREKGYYFKTANELVRLLNMIDSKNITLNFIQNLAVFSWNFITHRYKKLLKIMLMK
jgi:glycosyltransferase involved in cell wall biosynthesis